MFGRILVPTDFSAPSDAALAHAQALARAWNSTLHLLHATARRLTPPHEDGEGPEPAALRRMRDRLVQEDHGRCLEVRVVEHAAPADAILTYAGAADIDLIVMGTHGRTGVAHLLMGSVAETVVRGAPCPVLTVRHEPAAATFRRILVPTDFSGPSDAALDYGRLLQRRFGASVHLLHVLDDEQVAGPFGAEVFVTEPPDARAARLRDAHERLSHRVTSADRSSGRLTSEAIFGPVAATIVDYAGDNGFDLILMGTHGRTGLAHLLIGSVAERVIRGAACPVMTTHGKRPCVDVVAGVPDAVATVA